MLKTEEIVSFLTNSWEILERKFLDLQSENSSKHVVNSFSSEPGVSCFSKAFVQDGQTCTLFGPERPKPQDQKSHNKYEEVMGSLLYECASHEKLDLLSFWISAFQLQWQINRPGYCFVGAQLALITAMSKMEQNLISSEIIASILQSLKSRLVQQKEYAINPYIFFNRAKLVN